jgi:hypothetical protein
VKRATFDLSPQKRLCWAAPLLCWALCDCDDTATEAAAMEPPITTAPVVAILSTTNSPLNRPRSSGTKAKTTEIRAATRVRLRQLEIAGAIGGDGRPSATKGCETDGMGRLMERGRATHGVLRKGTAEGIRKEGTRAQPFSSTHHAAQELLLPRRLPPRICRGRTALTSTATAIWTGPCDQPVTVLLGSVLLAGIDGLFPRKQRLFFPLGYSLSNSFRNRLNFKQRAIWHHVVCP